MPAMPDRPASDYSFLVRASALPDYQADDVYHRFHVCDDPPWKSVTLLTTEDAVSAWLDFTASYGLTTVECSLPSANLLADLLYRLRELGIGYVLLESILFPEMSEATPIEDVIRHFRAAS